MHIEAFELFRLRLPLVTPFRTSAGEERERDVLLVRVEGEGVVGWGECVAMREPTYTSEYVEGAHHVVRNYLAPRLLAAGEVTPEQVGAFLSDVKGHPMAKACLEAAVIDAELRAAGRSMASYLGAVRSVVEVGVSVGMAESTSELLDRVAQHVEEGYRRVKLKIGPGWDVDPVRSVRERFGSSISLQVDANGSYALDDAEHLRELDAFDLLLVEQPLADHDLDGHAQLAKMLRTPICLDESIGSASDARRAIELGACAIVNIKPGRVGGYLEARRIHDLCAERGVPVWCGGMLETGIGRAANLALAGLPNFRLPADLSASARYFHRDVTAPFVLEDGCLAIPTGPGIGVEPDPKALQELTTGRERLARLREM